MVAVIGACIIVLWGNRSRWHLASGQTLHLLTRAKRDAAPRLIANGVDPAEKAKQDKIAASVAAANTFEAVANELLAKTERGGLSAITLKKNRWLIGFITPVLGRRPIAEITAHELLLALRSVEARGRHETAKRMRAICSQVFRYAIATARAERDVAADLKGALTVPKVWIRTRSIAGAHIPAGNCGV